jgi:NAD(P)H-hydrate epimerase
MKNLIGKGNRRFYKDKGLSEEELEHVCGVDEVKALRRPEKTSHKGEGGKLLIIGGSRLFHGASMWALKTASRIVDLVFYASVQENLEAARKIKSEVFDFIGIRVEEIDDYIKEADCILIGPGLMREEETKKLTERLLKKYPQKKWVIDAGSLQMMDWRLLRENCLITPHRKEFQRLFGVGFEGIGEFKFGEVKDRALFLQNFAKKFGGVILMKGVVDLVVSPTAWKFNLTGNEGMTKGGTGDVLAGLVAGFNSKNEAFLSACAGIFVNGLAGDRLKKRVGVWFNASDLCEEIPKTLKWCEDF